MKSDVTHKHRIFGLDVVRATAILLILFSHSTLLIFPDSQSIIVKGVQFFGTIGVDVFFVLSGFLIGTILIKHIENKQTSFKSFTKFWMRRWFRTLPNYYLVLLINIGLLFAFKTEIPERLYSYFFFLQNFNSQQPDFFTESWSLSIEEFAYLIGPIILLLFALIFKKLTKWSFLLMTLIIILVFTLNKYMFHVDFTNTHSDFSFSKMLRKVFIYRIDSIYYGFLGAFVCYYYNVFWLKIKWISFILGLSLFFGTHFYIFNNQLEPNQFSSFFNIWYLAIVSISILLTFPVFSAWKNTKRWALPITKISLWSYSIYLVNYSIVLISLRQFIDVSTLTLLEKVGVLLLFWFLTFSISYVLFKYFEEPILEFRERFRFTKSF